MGKETKYLPNIWPEKPLTVASLHPVSEGFEGLTHADIRRDNKGNQIARPRILNGRERRPWMGAGPNPLQGHEIGGLVIDIQTY